MNKRKPEDLSKAAPSSPSDKPLDKSIHLIIARHDGLHGIVHNVMGGKLLSEEHCANCRETAASLLEAFAAERQQLIAEFERLLDNGEMVMSDQIPTFNNLEEYIEHVAKIREVQREELKASLVKMKRGGKS